MISDKIVALFTQFGLEGLLLGVLFLFLFYIVRENSNERKEVRDAHKKERAEWLGSTKETNEKLERALSELTIIIRERSKH